jgi:outer membrane protein W
MTAAKKKKQEGINLKKYLALILGVLFVLSFAASAFAIHAEIPSETQAVVAKGGTQITLGGEIRVRGWYRDNIDADLPFSTQSQAYTDQRVRLAVDAAVSPNIKGYVMLETGSGTSDVYTWGSFNAKPTDMHINEAWILYTGSGLLGFNSGLKIGHMPLALGQKEFFDHTKFGDDAIVFFMDPTKQLHVGLLAIKFAEGSKFDNTDDLEGYVALTTFKINDNATVGLNYTYLNNSDGEFSHQNLGVHANGTVAGLGFKAFGDMQFGEAGDLDFDGYALGLGLSYKLDAVTIRAMAAMGSGDDDDDDSIDDFVTYLGADQHYTLVYDYQVIPAGGAKFDGLRNTTYFNIGVDYNASKDLSLSLDGYIIKATEDVAGEDDAGWEVDAKIKYALAKNLTYQIDAGYFDAGDMYEVAGHDAKGATVLRHALTLSF